MQGDSILLGCKRWSGLLAILALLPSVSGCTKVKLANQNKNHGAGTVDETKKAAPVVTSVTPNLGPFNASTNVTVNGQNFVSGATVRASDVDCGSVRFVSDSQLQCVLPPHAIGAVSVTVTNPDGQSGTLNNGYAYTSSVNLVPGFAVVSGGGVSAGSGILLKASIGEPAGGQAQQTAPGQLHRPGLQGALSD